MPARTPRSAAARARLAVLSAALGAGLSAQTDYHDQTLQFHLGRYLALKPQGYRLVSVDVSGDLASHRWAAVWEQGAGPAWIGGFGMGSADFTLWRNARLSEGYRDDWITSAGDGANRVYGAVMVQDNRTTWLSTDDSPTQFEAIRATFENAGFLLQSISVHGTARDPRYAAVFVENPGKVRWGYTVGNTATEYQTRFDLFVQQCWARPAVVTLSASHAYAAIFRDDEIGDWTARHDLTKAGYEAERTALAASGYRPYQIMVGGTGGNARYAALFVRGQPATRTVTVTGPAVPELDAVDRIMIGDPGTRVDGFMQDNNVREAAVAVARNGRLVLARGYTYAAPGYPATQPTTLFRLGSVTKTLTAIATYELAEQHRGVTMDARAFDLLGLQGTPADPRVRNIEVQHLIDHTSGYASAWNWDVVDKWSHTQNTLLGDTLAFTPGSQTAYSNPGYQLLGMVVEAQSGGSYLFYVRQNLWTPLGITRGNLLTTGFVPGQARCQEGDWVNWRLLRLAESETLPGRPLVNRAYSASPVHGDAAGGLQMSPVDYVRVLAGVFDRAVVPTVLSPTSRTALEARMQLQGRTGGWDFCAPRGTPPNDYLYCEKGGQWMSCHTFAARRSDGISIAVFCNGPTAAPIAAINTALDGVGSWPQHDLFPSFGLPELPRVTPGATTPYGTGCVGSQGMPVHTGSGRPEIGEVQQFVLARAAANAPAFLFLGFSRSTYAGLPLPLDLGFLGAPGCPLLTAPLVTLPAATRADGSAVLAFPHGFDPAHVGVHFFTQFTVLDPQANRLGLVNSNGLETVLGR